MSCHAVFLSFPQAGLDKIQARLDVNVAEREAVEAQNVTLGQNKAALQGQLEGTLFDMLNS